MPIYEYACTKCENEFEISQRITDEPLKRYKCPVCDKRTTVTKLISRSSFHLKGSGWYVTDYGKNGKKKEKGDDAKKTDAKTTGSKKDAATNSDTKSDAASSKKPKSTKSAATSD